MKIVFDNKELKNTEIYELKFYQTTNDWKNEVLVNSTSNNDIKVFSFYNCDNNDLTNLVYKTRKTQYFPIDINTKSYNLEM
ncbi:MAG: hypothetical protein LBC61_06345 [Candidatus Peribacteria bacterium]|nr:hypothetical protein [Candidatus Peribacteria bacterium]